MLEMEKERENSYLPQGGGGLHSTAVSLTKGSKKSTPNMGGGRNYEENTEDQG